MVREVGSEITALSLHCFTDGRESLERVEWARERTLAGLSVMMETKEDLERRARTDRLEARQV